MTELLFAADGAFGPDIAARTHHPASEYRHEMRGGSLPRKRPRPRITEMADGSTVEGGQWRVQAAEVLHCQPYLISLAYRLDYEHGSVVFAGDTAPTKSLARLARGTDVLVSGCHFINGDLKDRRLPGCCSGHLDAARAARDAGARILVLMHWPDELAKPSVRRRIRDDVRSIFTGQIVLGDDHTEIDV
jgi:ribonuclease BN (tRNA processing enzyme)